MKVITDFIKISGSEKSVSKTIEELLSLNDKIPKHTNKEPMCITEKQFDKSQYDTKKHRGEAEGITEIQLEDSDRESTEPLILEIRLEDTDAVKGGNRPEAWDLDKEKGNGHQHSSPLWLSVLDRAKEDKKLDKGQMEKKLKKEKK